MGGGGGGGGGGGHAGEQQRRRRRAQQAGRQRAPSGWREGGVRCSAGDLCALPLDCSCDWFTLIIHQVTHRGALHDDHVLARLVLLGGGAVRWGEARRGAVAGRRGEERTDGWGRQQQARVARWAGELPVGEATGTVLAGTGPLPTTTRIAQTAGAGAHPPGTAGTFNWLRKNTHLVPLEHPVHQFFSAAGRQHGLHRAEGQPGGCRSVLLCGQHGQRRTIGWKGQQG